MTSTEDDIERLEAELRTLPGLEYFSAAPDGFSEYEDYFVHRPHRARASRLAAQLFLVLLRHSPKTAAERVDILRFALASADDEMSRRVIAKEVHALDPLAFGYDLYEALLDDETPESIMAAAEDGIARESVGDRDAGAQRRIVKAVEMGGDSAGAKVLGWILRGYVSPEVLKPLCAQNPRLRTQVLMLWLADLVWVPPALTPEFGAWILNDYATLSAGTVNSNDWVQRRLSPERVLERVDSTHLLTLAEHLSALRCGLSRTLLDAFVLFLKREKVDRDTRAKLTYHLAASALRNGDGDWASKAIAGVIEQEDQDTWLEHHVGLACDAHPELERVITAARAAAPPPRYLRIDLPAKRSWRAFDAGRACVLDDEEDDIADALGVDDKPASVRRALAALRPADVASAKAVPTRFHPSCGTSTCTVVRDPVSGVAYFEHYVGGPGETFTGTTEGKSARSIAEEILTDAIPDEPASLRWAIHVSGGKTPSKKPRAGKPATARKATSNPSARSRAVPSQKKGRT
jgi:hypothetical protein